MESIGDILGKRQDIRENFEKLVAEVLKNADVQAFIAQHQMTSDEIQRSYSKFYEYVREHEKFEKGAWQSGHYYFWNQPLCDCSDHTCRCNHEKNSEPAYCLA